MGIANRDKWFFVSDTKPAPEHTPVNLNELREMFSIYGPKETDGVK